MEIIKENRVIYTFNAKTMQAIIFLSIYANFYFNDGDHWGIIIFNIYIKNIEYITCLTAHNFCLMNVT